MMDAKPSGSYNGILFIGDPHVAASPPGFRLDNYAQAILGKLAFCLDLAAADDYLPIVLGDLFHLPRNNPNHLLVELIELFRPVRPWVLVGNHDKHEARLTRDVSLAVLQAAGVILLMDKAGPVGSVKIGHDKVLIGASPDWTPLPDAVDKGDHDFVLWLTHHDLNFPDYDCARLHLKALPGVDLVVNGHIHTPKPPQKRGDTTWCNPGGITRVSLSRYTHKITPSVTLWRPGCLDLETLTIPHRPLAEVFPAFIDSPDLAPLPLDESMFIRGLENLLIRKTSEGVGLKTFLEANLDSSDPVDNLIWNLYEEVVNEINQN